MKMAMSGDISQGFFDKPGHYMASTFLNMKQWTIPWWDQHPDKGYPDFYLRQCCGFSEPLNMQLPCSSDATLLDEAAGRPIVALSMQGRAEYKNYQHNAQLAEQLEASDVYCWSQFDGSLPMQTTLNRLNTSQLLVTVSDLYPMARPIGRLPVIDPPGAHVSHATRRRVLAPPTHRLPVLLSGIPLPRKSQLRMYENST